MSWYKNTKVWAFVGGVAATSDAGFLANSPSVRRFAVNSVSRGMLIKEGAEASVQSVKDDAEDFCVEARSQALRHYGTAGSVMFLLGIPDILVDYAQARTRCALRNNLALHASTAWLVQGDSEVEKPEAVNDAIDATAPSGSIVYIAIGGKLAGALCISGSLRPETKQVVDGPRGMCLHTGYKKA